MSEDNKNINSGKIFTYAALISLAILIVSLLWIQAVGLFGDDGKIVSNQDELFTNAYGDLELGYDPLVTMVPEELQSLQSKSNIFVSSLDPKIGAKDPKIVITLFGNLENAETADLYGILESIGKKNQDDIIIVWKDFVVPADPPSIGQRAAEAAQCMAQQNEFWDFAKFIFLNQENLSEDFLKEAAKNQQIDYEEFTECFDKGVMRNLVEQSYYYGGSVEVTKSPTVFINDQKIDSDLTKENIENVVNNILDSFEK
ncbi:MAG: thioredoxin domain-containing protein [Patescibacteria group bacterium]|nr:thioredoxin domain-containing protein [Patescibacteria group bacterium]